MVSDAQSHAAEDEKRRAVIDARNQADSLAYAAEKTINENREKLPSQDVSRIDASIAEVRRAVQDDNLAAIKKAMDDLQRASHAIAEQLYKAGQGSQRSQGSQGSSSSNVKDAEVVDGEYAETQ